MHVCEQVGWYALRAGPSGTVLLPDGARSQPCSCAGSTGAEPTLQAPTWPVGGSTRRPSPLLLPRDKPRSPAPQGHCLPLPPSLTSPCVPGGWGSTGEPRGGVGGGTTPLTSHSGEPEAPLPLPGSPPAPENATSSGPCGQCAGHTGCHRRPAQRRCLPTAASAQILCTPLQGAASAAVPVWHGPRACITRHCCSAMATA